MNPTQLAKQMVAQLNQQPMVFSKKAKPIFVIKVPQNMSSTELRQVRDSMVKDDIKDDYHILVVPAQVDEFEFEMYNADRIEVQEWNKLVNKILK
jgi:diphthamide biosynthesis methyltransferase